MFPSRVLSVLASFALAGRVLSHGLRHDKRSSPLEVELAVPASGDVSELVARITNVGTADLNLLKVGTLLDDKLPVQKLVVLNEAGESTCENHGNSRRSNSHKATRSKPRPSFPVFSMMHFKASISNCSRPLRRSRSRSTEGWCMDSRSPGHTLSRSRG